MASNDRLLDRGLSKSISSYMRGRVDGTRCCSNKSLLGKDPVPDSRLLGDDGGCGLDSVGIGSGLVGGAEFKWAYLSAVFVVVILLPSLIVEL